MANSHLPDRAPDNRPQLRLFQPPEDGDDCGGVVSPRMTLPEFFEHWFLPVVLIGERDDGESTVKLYRDALAYWSSLTGNPPIAQIDQVCVAQFLGRLREATFKRSPLSIPLKLSKFTVAKHMRNLRAILYRLGPTTDPERPAKRLLEETPRIKLCKPTLEEPKPCFTLEQARRIAAAAALMDCPDVPRITPPAFWRAALAAMFYTGLRAGTVLQLEWSMLQRRADGAWLRVPGRIVDKTDKAITLTLHASALAAFEAVRTDQTRILPWPHCYEHFSTKHYELQELAGLPVNEQLSPQAWRRTNGNEMARLGVAIGMRVAQRALDHESVETTRESYVSLENELRRQLPEILPLSPLNDQRQRRLF